MKKTDMTLAQKLDAADFRKELVKLMPGYNWTVHKSHFPDLYLDATGIQSSGFNRISTLSVEIRLRDSIRTYEVKSAGFGKRAPWGATSASGTLARALRGLQDHYKNLAQKYRILEADLQKGRAEVIAP